MKESLLYPEYTLFRHSNAGAATPLPRRRAKMANKPGKDNLEDILCALRHEQATIREQAIQRLNTYANSAGGNTNDNTLTGAEAWEAGRRAIRQTLQQSLIVEALLIAIDD